jgi:hypothetical protein
MQTILGHEERTPLRFCITQYSACEYVGNSLSCKAGPLIVTTHLHYKQHPEFRMTTRVFIVAFSSDVYIYMLDISTSHSDPYTIVNVETYSPLPPCSQIRFFSSTTTCCGGCGVRHVEVCKTLCLYTLRTQY